jgi:uncharacterized repeat protein (TIGR01451 family)
VGITYAAPCLIDIAINAQDEMYGVDISADVLVQIDPHTGAATSIGTLGIDANHAQSLDFEEGSGILYWAAVDYRGHLRRIDTTTGNSISLGDFPNGTGVDCLAFATGGGEPFWGDVPWLSEIPTHGVILADDTYTVDIVFDTTDLTEGECYTATLGILHNDRQAAYPGHVPVTLCAAKPWPVFTLTKEVSPEIVLPGEPLTYTVLFGNDGSLETGITISDVLPSEMNYVWSDMGGAYDPVAHTVVWDDLVLDAGEHLTATIVVTLSLDVSPGAVITNTVYLLWRSAVYSDWVNIQVKKDELPCILYLPIIMR